MILPVWLLSIVGTISILVLGIIFLAVLEQEFESVHLFLKNVKRRIK